MVLERMRPARRYPEYWSRQFWLDFGAFAVMVLWSKVSQPMMSWLAASSAQLRLTQWDGVLPWPAKVVLVLLLTDFLNYWIHRGMHSYGTAGKILWRTHRWHHKTTRMTDGHHPLAVDPRAAVRRQLQAGLRVR